jgi:hypothetical protein
VVASKLFTHKCATEKLIYIYIKNFWLYKKHVVTAAIQQRVTTVLLSIPKEAFADSFQKLYERYQPCVVKDDYLEGQ